MKRTIVNKTRVALTVGLTVAAAFTACVEEGPDAPPLTGAPGPTQPAEEEDAGMGGTMNANAGSGGGGNAGSAGSGGSNMAGSGGSGMGGTGMDVDAGADPDAG